MAIRCDSVFSFKNVALYELEMYVILSHRGAEMITCSVQLLYYFTVIQHLSSFSTASACDVLWNQDSAEKQLAGVYSAPF